MAATNELLDVLVIGAGLSGIGAGYHLQTRSPKRTYAILEGRDAIGGTWDLFRYPGIRSDSDMYTLGFSFRPWKGAKAIADGPAILDYIEDTAREYGIDRKIRFGHRVERASWSSETSRWTVEVSEEGDGRAHDAHVSLPPHVQRATTTTTPATRPSSRAPSASAAASSTRRSGPSDIDYAGKRVVVIGSGATAVTLVPELAKTAAHVTMLQRSPTYILSRPAVDAVAKWLERKLPRGVAYDVTRWKNVALGMALFKFCRRLPERAKKLIVDQVKKSLGARLRRRYPLHAELQPVGSAPLPRAGRRSVRGRSRAAAPMWSPITSRRSPRRVLR